MTGIEICPKCDKSDWRTFTSNSTLKRTKRCNSCGFEASNTVDLKSAVKSQMALELKVILFGLLLAGTSGVIFIAILLGLSD
jgi:uncharacterized protein (DUF983 family)